MKLLITIKRKLTFNDSASVVLDFCLVFDLRLIMIATFNATKLAQGPNSINDLFTKYFLTVLKSLH